ncbi:MAG: endonuclease III domain-containing protein [Candidatus Melainabacteria bacterium]|jgi:endonuclease-3
MKKDFSNKLSEHYLKQKRKGKTSHKAENQFPIHKFKAHKFNALCHLTLQNNLNVSEERNSNHLPLDLLILLILNQSTTDTLSDRAFQQLKKDYPDNKQVNYEKILRENNPAKLVKSIQICGLASTKAKYILNALLYLAERGWLDLEMRFVNQMSDDEALKAITAIKGVAIKSASCLLMFGFGRNTFPIDTHLFRIFKKVGGILPLKTDSDRAHKLIQPLVEGIDAFTIHVGLIELGRKVCNSRKPLCNQCYLNKICDYALEKVEEIC